MRKLVVMLTATSVTFAATTFYLARELAAERARGDLSQPGAMTQPAPDVASAIRAASTPSPAHDPASPAEATQVRPNAAQPAERDARDPRAAYARHFLTQLADPQGREELLAERKLMMRNSYPRLDRALALTPEEYSRLLELFALQQLELQERHSRCVVQPGCQESPGAQPDPREREIADLLGHRQPKFEAYRNSIGERETVTQLRARLPDTSRLSDENAEHLIAALADERNRLHQEAAASGTGLRGFGLGSGLIFSPAEGGSFEERYEAARRNSQRLRDRAAPYLTPEQQRAFDEMQDETLLTLRSQLRHKDLYTGAGNGSG